MLKLYIIGIYNILVDARKYKKKENIPFRRVILIKRCIYHVTLFFRPYKVI